MNLSAQEFLKTLLTTPSTTGFEEPVQEVVRNYVSPFADKVHTDVHGNVIAVRNPDAPLRIMLAGHCDQIGMIVNYIDDQGFIYVLTVGGWDIQNLVGVRVKIWTRFGPIDGVIGKKAIHLMDEEERQKTPKIKELWIDIGALDKEEAERFVQIGDPVTVELEYRELLNGLIAAPATDDKAGLWVAMEALRRIDAAKLSVAVYAVSTVQEEVGLRGSKTCSYGIDPHVAIATDVTHASDTPSIDKKVCGFVELGCGPVLERGPNMNTILVDGIVETAKRHGIPFQMTADGRITGTDAGSIQVNRSGVATALMSIPNRYMHTAVEVISLHDIDYAADLMARYCESLSPEDSFIPTVRKTFPRPE